MNEVTFSKNYHPEALAALKQYKNLKDQIETLEAEAEKARAIIIAAMELDTVAHAKVNGIALKVTWKNISSTRLDTKAIKSKYPAIAAECSTTTAAPRLTIK